jgi:ABC-type multidrug transport system fused ATPase/permease subunit
MFAQALVPAVIGRAIEAGVVARDRNALVMWSAILLGLAVIQAFTSLMRDRYTVTNRIGAAFTTLQVVTKHVSWLGGSLARRVTAGEAVSVGAADVTTIGSAISRVGRGAGAVVGVITVAVVMLTMSWQLSLVVLIGVPLMVWITTRLIRPLSKRDRRVRTLQAGLSNRAIDIVSGLRVLRGLGGEGVFVQRYHEDSQEVRWAAVSMAKMEALIDAVKAFLPGLLTAIIVWLGARLVVSGHLNVGQLVSFYAYAVFLVGPLRWLNYTAEDMTSGYVAARRVTDILTLRPDLASGDRAGDAGPAPALADPESGLTVAAGSLTAVVCAGPAQAAVIADRLGRYVDSDVSCGGTALREFPLDEVRQRILVVRNDARFFAGPLRAQLDPAARAVTAPGLLEDATDTASARDIVDSLPEGFDGLVAEGARNFSGGEQQRLRLLRALMFDPDVLVLVDPTSAVDAHTEARIARRLRAHRHGRTTVVFTTSPIVLDQADFVAYVEDDTVTAQGTSGEMLSCDPYRRFVARENAS